MSSNFLISVHHLVPPAFSKAFLLQTVGWFTIIVNKGSPGSEENRTLQSATALLRAQKCFNNNHHPNKHHENLYYCYASLGKPCILEHNIRVYAWLQTNIKNVIVTQIM